ncbi:MAG TPA: L,D-transpeptidase [Vicinamibacterales bacterium]|nr:L,D-transpeptidase [Vicinamibacterales bacterium]
MTTSRITRALTMTAAMAMLAASEARASGHANGAAAVTPVTRRIVVSIPDRKLAVIENDQVIRVFRVAVGAPESPSPVGTFTIVNRVTNPTYYRPGKVIAPGTTNPIGTRWIGLSEKGFGIHGTDDPASIGHARSHGCIRLRNADIEKLFDLVRSGDVVELHPERTQEIAAFFN